VIVFIIYARLQSFDPYARCPFIIFPIKYFISCDIIIYIMHVAFMYRVCTSAFPRFETYPHTHSSVGILYIGIPDPSRSPLTPNLTRKFSYDRAISRGYLRKFPVFRCLILVRQCGDDETRGQYEF